jgi:hypothetical protein
MTNKEYLNKIKDSIINLERLNIVVGMKTNIPYSTVCFQEEKLM